MSCGIYLKIHYAASSGELKIKYKIILNAKHLTDSPRGM